MTRRGSSMGDANRGWVVDVGGTNLRVALVERGRGVVFEKRAQTPLNRGPESVLGAIWDLVRTIPNAQGPFKGMVMGIPGIVDSAAGTVLANANLGWHNVPIQQLAEGCLKMPVRVENDVRLHTLGEWRCGEGTACQTMVDAVIGTGIAAGLVVNGQMLSGTVIGEIGHLTWERPGVLCGCGKTGCVETVVGAKGLRRLMRESGYSTQDFVRDVVGPLARDEPRARRVWQEFSQALAFALSSLILGIYPEVIVLSGGIVASFGLWESMLLDALSHELFAAARENWQLRISTLGDTAPYLGGMSLLFDDVRTERVRSECLENESGQGDERGTWNEGKTTDC